jgi:hypothetical protein
MAKSLVARAIVAQAERPRRMVVVGSSAGLLSRPNACTPALATRFTTWMIERQHWRTEPTAPTSGNLFTPVLEGTEPSGGWRDRRWPIARRAPRLAGTPR